MLETPPCGSRCLCEVSGALQGWSTYFLKRVATSHVDYLLVVIDQRVKKKETEMDAQKSLSKE